MLVVIEKTNKEVVLEGEPLARGGEALIYPLPDSPDLVAKVYHRATSEQAEKLTLMIAAPPNDPMLPRGHVSIAWPIDRLLAANAQRHCVGYTMRRVDRARRIMEFYNPRSRLQMCPQFHYGYLLRTARNLAAAFRAVHERGYVIGDVNESNILTTTQALVTLVDTDSFQVRVADKVHRCLVGKTEYTPPELQGSRFADVDRSAEHDVFGLAALVFQLLMQGTHPFAGVYTGEGDPASMGRRISDGLWPYSRSPAVQYVPNPHAPPFETLPPVVQQLMRRCFEEAYGRPSLRPDALSWQRALQESEKDLASCSVNPQHVFHKELASCPWCELARRQKRDPFPSRAPLLPAAAVADRRSGQDEVLEVLPADPIPVPPVPHSCVVEVTPIVLPESLSAVEILPATAIVDAEDITDDRPLVRPRTRLKTERIAPEHNPQPLISGNALTWIFSIAIGLVLLGVVLFLVLRSRFGGGSDEPDVLRGHQAAVTALAISTDSREALSADRNGSIRHWNIIREELIAALPGHKGEVRSIVFHPQGEPRALSGGADRAVRLWDLNQHTELNAFSGHEDTVTGVAFCPDGGAVVSCSTDGSVRVWDLKTLGERTRWIDIANPDTAFNCLAITRDGNRIACGTESGRVMLFDLDKNRRVLTKRGECVGHEAPVTSVAFSPDGQYLFSAGDDNTARMWNTTRLTQIRTFEGHTDSVESLAVSQDGKRLITGSLDHTVCLWDVATGRTDTVLTKPKGGVLAVAFAPDGTLAASGGEDKVIRKWRL